MYGGFSAVVLEENGRAGREGLRHVRSGIFCLGCFRSIRCDAVYQRSAVPEERQGGKEKWRGTSEKGKCADWSFKDSVKREFQKARTTLGGCS